MLDLIGGGSRSTTPISMHSRKSPTADMGIQVNKKKGNASSVVVPSIVVGSGGGGGGGGNSSSYNNNKEVISGGASAAVLNNSGGGGGNASNTTTSKRNNNQNNRREQAAPKRDELATKLGGGGGDTAEAAGKADLEANGIRVNFNKPLSIRSLPKNARPGRHVKHVFVCCVCELNAQSHDYWIRWLILAANTNQKMVFYFSKISKPKKGDISYSYLLTCVV